ncbi:uncharacterized protein N7473_001742 [Penicillium subrubescens]|uniref:Nonribosomal peptide synthetase 1 n=1 Tax=Penicillium subrubescens TaxID=1316194 RepID=A0A1Q5T392_9EURO|nr:uncharacterized protein N7473_001742 [Penicillium subrubescens]KAJ5904826.1 hypothetical protein N7473_001742 [Penicillium subrubescens]OKO94684.1 Nonribosomal peptide synthetase 1 [Penicillium subrubescens]
MAIDDTKRSRIISSYASAVLDIPPDSDKWDFKLLTTWLLLLRDYYAQEIPGFIYLRPTTSSNPDWVHVSKDLRAQVLSIAIEPEASVSSTQHLVSQEVGKQQDDGSVKLNHKTCVLMLRDDEIEANGSHQEIAKIFERLKVELLLTISTSGGASIASIWNDALKQPAFSPCRVLKSFTQIFEQVSSQPNIKADEIFCATDLDIESMCSFNSKKDVKNAEIPECLHVLINTHYMEHPQKTALSSSTRDMSYLELGQKSAAVAQILVNRGVRPGETVGICLEKSIWTITILLGILRAGAAYVPMDPSYPPGRITQILARADIRHLVISDTLRKKLGDIMAESIVLSENEDLHIPHDWSKEKYKEIHDPAYIIFTSGSTGTPKGVIQHHKAVSLSLVECIEAFEINSSTRFMQFSSLAFDASILELWSPLVAGGCVCVPSEEERSSDLESTMRMLRVTDAWLTAGLVKQLQPENLPDLARLSVGGEAPSEDVITTWGNRVKLNNLYGTTEAGVWDTAKLAMEPGDNPRNIGRGIGKVSCWIADPSNAQRLRPVGAEGELLVQSPYLAHGYLKDPELSAGVFLHPSSLKWGSLVPISEGSRIYRTGDLAKFTADGDIVFLGRQGGFIKIRGLRVDLGEVEHAINSTASVYRSAIVLSKDGGSNVEMAAFVETTEKIETQLADVLHTRLSKVLPSYMIPTMFIPVEKLPMTTSKKIDRPRLRRDLSQMSQKSLERFRKGGSVATEYSTIPSTKPRAIEISCMVADLLTSRDKIYADSFRGKDFPLETVGLSSMQLVSLATLLRKRYNKKITIGSLRCHALTVCDVEDLVLKGKKETADGIEARNLIDDLTKLKPKLPFAYSRRKTVFLTSITGFLGSQILRSLLRNPEIEHIIGLVRAKTEEEARGKVEHQAKLGQWWEPSFFNRIEVWLGDLGKPQLGLNTSHMNRLWGRHGHSPVDGIVHNGARVNWIESYEELEPVNVHSTLEILSGLSEMTFPCPLIYISGGYMPTEQESLSEVAKKLSSAPGYDQTKFMSELLLEEYNKHLDKQKGNIPKARTIIPGFIVGTRQEGIAHQEDFLWRFAFSIARLQAVSKDLLGHLNVAGVDQVSNLVTDVLLQPDRYDKHTLKCFDGINVLTLCNILEDKLNIKIKKFDHSEWMEILRSDIDQADFDHPFAPVFEWLQANPLGTASQGSLFNEQETVTALERSVEYLVGIDYFLEGSHKSGPGKSVGFSRSNF